MEPLRDVKENGNHTHTRILVASRVNYGRERAVYFSRARPTAFRGSRETMNITLARVKKDDERERENYGYEREREREKEHPRMLAR